MYKIIRGLFILKMFKVIPQKFFEIKKILKIFKCNVENCKKQFQGRGNLEAHLRTHSGERPFKCPIENCEKAFITQSTLNTHLISHTGKKPFYCDYEGCGKGYTRYFRLKIHKRTHCGLKPFKCPFKYCNKSFNEKGNLKTHSRIHTGEKPFVCNISSCRKAFKAHGHLKDHLKRHSLLKPFSCELCTAKFSRSSTLKIHMHIHTGIKPFICEFPGCERKFAEKGNMKSHYKIHTKFENDKDDYTTPSQPSLENNELNDDLNLVREGLCNGEISKIKNEFILNEISPKPVPIIEMQKDKQNLLNLNFLKQESESQKSPCFSEHRKIQNKSLFFNSFVNNQTTSVTPTSAVNNQLNQLLTNQINQSFSNSVNYQLSINSASQAQNNYGYQNNPLLIHNNNLNLNILNNSSNYINFYNSNEDHSPLNIFTNNLIQNFAISQNQNNIFNSFARSPRDFYHTPRVITSELTPSSLYRGNMNSPGNINIINNIFNSNNIQDLTPISKNQMNQIPNDYIYGNKMSEPNLRISNPNPSFSEMVNLTVKKIDY